MTEYEAFVDLFGDDMDMRRGYFYTKPLEALVSPPRKPNPHGPDDYDDDEEIVIEKCAVCGLRGLWGDPVTGNIQLHGQGPLWAGLNMDFCEVRMCESCYKKSIPYAVKLRDILELRMYVNKLKRVINERNKAENDRKYAHDAGKRR
mgnify:CR=1 FL=1